MQPSADEISGRSARLLYELRYGGPTLDFQKLLEAHVKDAMEAAYKDGTYDALAMAGANMKLFGKMMALPLEGSPLGRAVAQWVIEQLTDFVQRRFIPSFRPFPDHIRQLIENTTGS